MRCAELHVLCLLKLHSSVCRAAKRKLNFISFFILIFIPIYSSLYIANIKIIFGWLKAAAVQLKRLK